MNAIIDAALARSRPVILILALILVAGTVAYINIPKEADPDVAIPIIYVSIHHEGISSEDAERLLIRPMENELRSIEGLKELRAHAVEGNASLVLEFEAGFDSDSVKESISPSRSCRRTATSRR
jgi:multidrug efflux pump